MPRSADTGDVPPALDPAIFHLIDAEEERPDPVSDRPVRGGHLQTLLDEEFSRNYRFEMLSNFFGEIRGFVRNVFERDEDDEDLMNMSENR